jgi:hypothetical protein
LAGQGRFETRRSFMADGILGVVACDVLKAELEAVAAKEEAGDLIWRFNRYALHSSPNLMPGVIMEAVGDLRAQGAERIALGYGLCSHGSSGVSSDKGLVMPRCHDCISMLLGSPKRYMEMFRKFPGTYFLSEGWVRNEADPLSSALLRYAKRLGEKKAMRAMSLELANYRYICFVNNGVGDIEVIRERTKENCRAFEKEYLEVEADLAYFRNLLKGPHPEESFIVLGPSGQVEDELFYSDLYA